MSVMRRTTVLVRCGQCGRAVIPDREWLRDVDVLSALKQEGWRWTETPDEPFGKNHRCLACQRKGLQWV